MATFPAGLEFYLLVGVKVFTDRVVGHGSYATVLELEYMGLRCSGKKIHDPDDTKRFANECRLLSRLRHPNIVCFLGLHFQQVEEIPILVMEFLPTNLASCIEQYHARYCSILPKGISYSILHDVALGLRYLHSETPPIIHGDLSSNNILLTSSMTAKISDFGRANVLGQEQANSGFVWAPGNPDIMPPEAMVANPTYSTSIDEFSYGVLMIHTFSGKYPKPQVAICTKPDGTMIPVSEAERRKVFLRAIGKNHPLMDLILKCIHNHPQARANADEIVKRLVEMVLQFPVTYASGLEMRLLISRLVSN